MIEKLSLLEKPKDYEGQEKFLVAVDCVIFGFDGKEIKLLLFKRKVQPLQGHWSLIGAFINSNMTLEESAKQILLELTGLENIYLEELKTFSKVNRDPGGRVISVAFYSLIRLDEMNMGLVGNYQAKWFGLKEIPNLILDHEEMVELSISALRLKARRYPIGFNLLPQKFTLPQIQILYESIYQQEIDNRNFRKKLLSYNILIKTDEKDKSESRKGAFLYEFNKENFDSLVKNQFNFEL